MMSEECGSDCFSCQTAKDSTKWHRSPWWMKPLLQADLTFSFPSEKYTTLTTETVTLWAVFLLSHLWTTWEGVQWGIVKGKKVVLQQKSKSFSSWKRRQNNDRVSKLLCIWEPLRQSETASLEKLASLARVCVCGGRQGTGRKSLQVTGYTFPPTAQTT